MKPKVIDPEMIAAVKKIIFEQSELEKKFKCGNIFRNQKYREYFLAHAIKNIDPSYDLVTDKVDFITSNSSNGEMKSCKVVKLKNNLYSLSKGCFEFDKQNDPVRRENTLKYDGFSFGIFDASDESTIVGIIYIKDPVGVQYVIDLLRKKQEDFIKKMEESSKQNKQISRDSIQVAIKEIFDCPVLTVLDQDGKEISLDLLKAKFNQAKPEATAA